MWLRHNAVQMSKFYPITLKIKNVMPLKNLEKNKQI